MNVTPNAAASQVAEQWQGESIAHWVDVQVWNKLRQRLPSQEYGPNALPQQREVREQAGLHKHTMPQEHKVNWPREHNVKTTPRPLENLLAGHTHISCVHHKVDILVPVQKLKC